MRILHLATLLEGGTGRIITSLAEAQRRAGHEVTVVTSRSASDDDLVHCAKAHGWDLALETGPSVLHAHAAVPSRIAVAIAAASRNVAVLQTLHGCQASEWVEPARDLINLISRLPRIVVPSHTLAAQLEGLGVEGARLAVVPYGVDAASKTGSADDTSALEQAAFGVIDAQRARGRAIVCSVGTIGERENQRLLVDALALLPPASRPYTVFVGDGDIAGLEQHACNRGVGTDMLCVGFAPDSRR